MADDVPVGIQYITLLTYLWVTILNCLVPMADSENAKSPQIKLFRECSWGFRTKDPVLITKTLHKDFCNVPYPQSLGQSEKTKEEWLNHWAGIVNLWASNTKVSYIGYTSDPCCRN